jgi:predicted GNAT family N-acyltransferase
MYSIKLFCFNWEAVMIKCIDVEFGSSRYKELLDLRYKILLQPLGLKFLDSYREEEANFLHIGCIDNSTGELIGGLILAPIDDEEIRVMQVAVDVVHQGEGIGKKLIEYAESVAKKIGYSRIVMHAMLSVVGFYEKLGFSQDSDLFEEKGVNFIRMVKEL